MPNWCQNTLTLHHEDPAMLERAKAAFTNGKFFNEFIPCPQELIDTVSGYVPEQEALEAKQAANREKYGYSTWYEFNVSNWGTKWDVGGNDGLYSEESVHTIVFNFDSAWSPPIAAYERLMEQGFTVEAMYHESGMCFAGMWENGRDDYYEYSDKSSEQLAEFLPTELDDAFGISESVAEWEADQD